MQNHKTIRQIADEIGVSKQAIQKRLSREPLYTHIQQHTQVVDRTKYISITGVELIKEAFEMSTRTDNVHIDDTTTESRQTDNVHTDVYTVLQTTIEALQKQLDIKDVQIAEKDKQINELLTTNKSLSASINADRHHQLAETLIDGELKPLNAVQPTKKGLFSRIFKKKE